MQVLEKRSGWRGRAVQPSPFRQRVEVVVLAVVLAGRLRLRVLGCSGGGGRHSDKDHWGFLRVLLLRGHLTL